MDTLCSKSSFKHYCGIFRLSYCRRHLGRTFVVLFVLVSIFFFIIDPFWQGTTLPPPLRMLKSNNPFIYEKIFVDPGKNTEPQHDKELYLLILVSSSPHNKESERRRNAIRRTWGNCKQLHSLYSESKEIPLKCTCKLIFYLGRSPKNEADILQESAQHNDLLIVDYMDSYSSITRKQMLAFKWAAALKPKFILKTDDDVFIHTPRLIMKLQLLSKPDVYYGGIILNGTKVVREKSHRHYISLRQYKQAYYPPYCKGSLYVFSGNLLPRLVEAADVIPYMHVDDAYVGILMYYLGVEAQSINHFLHFRVVAQPFRYTLSDCALKFMMGISDGLTGDSIFTLHVRLMYLDAFPMVCFTGTVAEVICFALVVCWLVFLYVRFLQ